MHIIWRIILEETVGIAIALSKQFCCVVKCEKVRMFSTGKEEKKEESSKPFHSFLSLICPGSGRSYGTGKKMAVETNNKKNNVKISKQFIKDCVNLTGCDQDAAS